MRRLEAAAGQGHAVAAGADPNGPSSTPPRAEHPPCCEWLTVATALLVQKFDKDGDGEMGLQDMRVLMQRLEKL